MSFLEIRDVTKTFASRTGSPVPALAQVSLDVEQEEFVCIVGPSGGGKSTLLNIVAGFVGPTAGNVFVNGSKISEPSVRRVMVFQEFALFPWLTVKENVAFGLEMQGVSKGQRSRIATTYLELVKLTRFAATFPSELSGGMKQRVAIARALAVDPEMLLMDEPFGALDAHTRGIMQSELLRIWEQKKKTVLFVTHSVDEAVFLSDRVIVMAGRPGRVHANLPVSMPRPRDETASEFIELRSMIKGLVLDASKGDPEAL